MNVLHQPDIIEKVFDFLQIVDLYQCQYVCRAWNEAAIWRLRKCPPINKCQLDFSPQEWNAVINSNEPSVKNRLPFGYPTIVVKQELVGLCSQFASEILGTPLRMPEAIKDPFDWGPKKPPIELHHEGFCINRHAANCKITVTNWSDPQSARPDLKSTECPVKSLIYLATPSEVYSHSTRKIRSFVQESNLVLSGGLLLDNSKIFVNHVEKCNFKAIAKISIAFAGKKVKSSLHMIKKPAIMQRELEEFRSKLKFPLDNNRTIGFLMYSGFGWEPFAKFSSRASKVFPEIAFTRINFSKLITSNQRNN
ncbi:uncharacterized protein LOC141849903 isoform X2 [Brevipalpus obovatus]|uniref:uncharacterized protein LOC141849903 isoform X2 n=1 Tax=Brevipalpus obovatus TaxID=246614 RepID=UPI003D9DD17E